MTSNRMTFRKDRYQGGLRGVSWMPSTEVKLDGLLCATIRQFYKGDGSSAQWSVSVIVSTDKYPCGWRWAELKKPFSTEPEARQWLMDNKDELIKTHGMKGV